MYFRRSHLAEWCKPSDDQSVVIQTTDPDRSALWRLIAFLRRGWSRWSSFGGRRVREEERARGWGKTIVFGILERHGKVHTEIVPNAAKKPLQDASRGRVATDSIIHSDGLEGLRWAGG